MFKKIIKNIVRKIEIRRHFKERMKIEKLVMKNQIAVELLKVKTTREKILDKIIDESVSVGMHIVAPIILKFLKTIVLKK